MNAVNLDLDFLRTTTKLSWMQHAKMMEPGQRLENVKVGSNLFKIKFEIIKHNYNIHIFITGINCTDELYQDPYAVGFRYHFYRKYHSLLKGPL